MNLSQIPLVIWTLFSFIMSSLWNAVYLVMCLILAAAAVGRYVSILETFELTDFWPVFGAATIINITALIAAISIEWLPFSIVFNALFSAIYYIFHVSVLTTLYQHYIEDDFDTHT